MCCAAGSPAQAPPAQGELLNAPHEGYEGYDYEGYERSYEARRAIPQDCAKWGTDSLTWCKKGHKVEVKRCSCQVAVSPLHESGVKA